MRDPSPTGQPDLDGGITDGDDAAAYGDDPPHSRRSRECAAGAESDHGYREVERPPVPARRAKSGNREQPKGQPWTATAYSLVLLCMAVGSPTHPRN